MAIDRVLDSLSPTIEKPMSSVSVAQGGPPGLPPRRPPLFAYLVLGLIALWVGPAAAHTADKNMRRTFVIERVDAGLLLYVRSPGPFIFGDAIAEMLGTGKQIESPFVRLERSFQRIGYRLQRKAVKEQEERFRGRLARAFVVHQHDRPLPLTVRDFRIFRHADDSSFGSPKDARASLERIEKPANPWLKESMVEVSTPSNRSRWTVR